MFFVGFELGSSVLGFDDGSSLDLGPECFMVMKTSSIGMFKVFLISPREEFSLLGLFHVADLDMSFDSASSRCDWFSESFSGHFMCYLLGLLGWKIGVFGLMEVKSKNHIFLLRFYKCSTLTIDMVVEAVDFSLSRDFGSDLMDNSILFGSTVGMNPFITLFDGMLVSIVLLELMGELRAEPYFQVRIPGVAIQPATKGIKVNCYIYSHLCLLGDIQVIQMESARDAFAPPTAGKVSFIDDDLPVFVKMLQRGIVVAFGTVGFVLSVLRPRIERFNPICVLDGVASVKLPLSTNYYVKGLNSFVHDGGRAGRSKTDVQVAFDSIEIDYLVSAIKQNYGFKWNDAMGTSIDDFKCRDDPGFELKGLEKNQFEEGEKMSFQGKHLFFFNLITFDRTVLVLGKLCLEKIEDRLKKRFSRGVRGIGILWLKIDSHTFVHELVDCPRTGCFELNFIIDTIALLSQGGFRTVASTVHNMVVVYNEVIGWGRDVKGFHIDLNLFEPSFLQVVLVGYCANIILIWSYTFRLLDEWHGLASKLRFSCTILHSVGNLQLEVCALFLMLRGRIIWPVIVLLLGFKWTAVLSTFAYILWDLLTDFCMVMGEVELQDFILLDILLSRANWGLKALGLIILKEICWNMMMSSCRFINESSNLSGILVIRFDGEDAVLPRSVMLHNVFLLMELILDINSNVIRGIMTILISLFEKMKSNQIVMLLVWLSNVSICTYFRLAKPNGEISVGVQVLYLVCEHLEVTDVFKRERVQFRGNRAQETISVVGGNGMHQLKQFGKGTSRCVSTRHFAAYKASRLMVNGTYLMLRTVQNQVLCCSVGKFMIGCSEDVCRSFLVLSGLICWVTTGLGSVFSNVGWPCANMVCCPDGVHQRSIRNM